MFAPYTHRGITIAQHGKRWRFRIVVDGTLHRHSFPTLKEAIDALDQVLDRRAAAPAAIRGPAVRIAPLCAEWLERQTHLAPATRSNYEIHIRCHIAPKVGELDANLVRPIELEDFYRSLTFSTARKSHMVLRGTFDWAIRNERLVRPSNPTLFARPSRRSSTDHDGHWGKDDDVRTVPDKTIPTRDEVRLLMKDAHARDDRWWWLYLVVVTTTGARPGEVCALRRRSFDLDEHAVRIDWTADKVSKRVKRPKSPWSERTLHLAPAFFELVESQLPVDGEAFLFPSDRLRGSLLPCKNSRSIERKLDRKLRQLGLPHYTPHGFRHFVATHMLDEGHSPIQVGKFLGHRDDTMVRKLYGNHIIDDTQRTIGAAASRITLGLETLQPRVG